MCDVEHIVVRLSDGGCLESARATPPAWNVPPTWERGRGWAVSLGAIGVPYYRDTVRAFAQRISMVEAVLSES